ncbi:trichothecene 3-O-acetyltransferas-like protein [Boeremia exigua]|uniref:trichothecene 3-O-acetyltransferase-like protein n=1 Tax=Boeremia exigua TaxID=749465 RepID=UPI001E8D0FFE|nr:trichothecene 3-O-acetyltransferase-like protein [Boeremia exigua]KAH6639870.1 trichothecene 3-O-acetyltransferas-like protein [Boeremia exigua]
MIVKAESPPAEDLRSFHLSFLDQNAVRVYTQTLCIFPFPDQNNAEAAIHALDAGLRLTIQKFPFLAGMLSLAGDGSGRLQLEYPVDVTGREATKGLFAAKLIVMDDFPHHYERLKKTGMPPSAFRSATFLPDDFANYPGVPANGEGLCDFNQSDAPVMRIQACFIPGGLVLSVYIHHSVLDFHGISTFWESLAANVSHVAQTHGSRDSDSVPLSIADYQSSLRAKLDERVSYSGAKSATADCYCDGAFRYRKTLPDDTECTQRLFVLPAERVRKYRERLRPHFPLSSPPTLCNVLAALVWTHVTRARAARLARHGYVQTNCGIATDLRMRWQPPVGADYTGNCALFSKCTTEISDLTSEECVTDKTILHVIKKIKNTITSVNNAWIDRHFAFFKGLQEIKDTECALALRFGSDCYITSWLNFGADYRWGIPGTDLAEDSLGGRPEFIRRAYGPGDGGIIFLPRRRHVANDAEAPFEILVRLTKEDMDRVLNEDGGLCSWSEAVVL